MLRFNAPADRLHRAIFVAGVVYVRIRLLGLNIAVRVNGAAYPRNTIALHEFSPIKNAPVVLKYPCANVTFESFPVSDSISKR